MFSLYNRIEIKKINSYSLTIDGFTLTYIFELNLKNLFLKVAMKCDAVLCVRMSPSQKASVCHISIIYIKKNYHAYDVHQNYQTFGIVFNFKSDQPLFDVELA
jgi:hypothetical protein